jgi:hypothetical protein
MRTGAHICPLSGASAPPRASGDPESCLLNLPEQIFRLLSKPSNLVNAAVLLRHKRILAVPGELFDFVCLWTPCAKQVPALEGVSLQKEALRSVALRLIEALRPNTVDQSAPKRRQPPTAPGIDRPC